jgi:hypothetical protein
MAIYRSKKGAKKYVKKRRSNKALVNMGRQVNIKKDVHYFKRSFIGATITGNVAYSPYTAGVFWTLGSLPNVSDFTNLFDRYMITYVKCFIHLKLDPSSQSATLATLPKLYYVRDYDDATTPSSINELREHSKCTYRVMNPNRPIVIGIKPATLALAYRSAVASTYSPKWKTWIDMATTDVPHYGLKLAIDDLTNTNYKVDFEYKIWFACKDTR